MSNHTTGTSPGHLALSGSAAHCRLDPAQSKFLTWYMSQHLTDVNLALHGYCKHCLPDEYLTANPTALRQEDPR